jgi:Amt family ammonium transporter
VALFVFVGTWILLLLTDAITPMRVTEEDEALGLDVSQHNERL